MKKPIHKRVKAGGIGGALAVLVIAVLDRTVGFHPTPVESSAIAVVVTYVASWLPDAPE